MIKHATTTHPPQISPPPFPINHSTCSGTLKNSINGHVIKTKNISMTFQCAVYERSLINAVRGSESKSQLKGIPAIKEQINQIERISSLGHAAFARDNPGEHTDRTTSLKLGLELIPGLKTVHENTIDIVYTAALCAGLDAKQDHPDKTNIHHFAVLSQLFMNKTQEK